MNDLDYMEQLLKRYKTEAEKTKGYGMGYQSPTKIKRIGIELRQAMLEFERKNFI